MRIHGKTIAAIISAAIILLVLLFSGGIYYETTNDTIAQVYISGLYSDGINALPDTFGFFVILSSILNRLYTISPDINWYDIFHITILFIALSLFFRLLFRRATTTSGSAAALLVITGAFAGTALLMPVEVTKTAMVLACVSLIGLYRRDKIPAGHTILFNLLFVLTLLIRIEAGVLAFVITALFFLFSRDNKGLWLKNSILPLLAIGIVSLWLNHPKTPEETYYLAIRPYEYVLTDFDRQNAKADLTTREDSVTFHACTQFFFADSSKCNLSFFKKIHLVQFDKTPWQIIKNTIAIRINPSKLQEYFSILSQLRWLIVLWLLSCLAISKWHDRGLSLIIINFLLFVLLAAISIVLKPEEHVLCPSLILMFLINTLVIREQLVSYRYSWLVIVILFIPISGEAARLYHKAMIEADKASYYKCIGDYIRDHPGEETILNIGTWDEGNHKMFQNNAFATIQNSYVLDGGILYINGGYQKMICRATGSHRFVNQWDFFAQNKGCIFISSQERMNMIVEYINTLYKRHYIIVCKQTFESAIPGIQPLGIYTLME